MSSIICTVFEPVKDPRFKGWVVAREFTPKTMRYIEYDTSGKERWRVVWRVRKNTKITVEERIMDAMRGSI